MSDNLSFSFNLHRGAILNCLESLRVIYFEFHSGAIK